MCLKLVRLFESVQFHSIDKSLNWLSKKARFDGGFNNKLKLSLINGFIILLEMNASKLWLCKFPNDNKLQLHLRQNHGSLEPLTCWISVKCKLLHLGWIQELQRSQTEDSLSSSTVFWQTPHGYLIIVIYSKLKLIADVIWDIVQILSLIVVN